MQKINSIVDELHEWRNYFQRTEVVGSIQAQSSDTLSWMRRNTDSFSVEGHLIKGSPWWFAPKHTDDDRLIECRNQLMRDRAYEHGILHFLFGLNERGVIRFSADSEELKILTQATTPKVINQLIMLTLANVNNGSISLVELAAFYCYSENVKSAKVRDRYLVRLAPLGIYTARMSGGYDIRLGPVAEKFFNEVYFPIINETLIMSDDNRDEHCE